jgi:SAM-dependent methyltransferase
VDVVVSTEMLEHDPFWQQTLQAAAAHLRPGGLLAFSCASRARPEHHLEDSPTPGYYGGRDPDEMLEVLRKECEWSSLHGRLERNGLDTFVWGVRA